MGDWVASGKWQEIKPQDPQATLLVARQTFPLSFQFAQLYFNAITTTGPRLPQSKDKLEKYINDFSWPANVNNTKHLPKQTRTAQRN